MKSYHKENLEEKIMPSIIQSATYSLFMKEKIDRYIEGGKKREKEIEREREKERERQREGERERERE